MAPLSLMTYLRDHYEVLGGYWYRYILGFDAAQSFEIGTHVAEGIRDQTRDWAKSFRELANFSAFSDGARLKDGAILTMITLVILAITGVFWLGFRMLRLALLGEGAGPRGTLAWRRALVVVWLGIRYRLSLRQSRAEVLRQLSPPQASALRAWLEAYDAARFGPQPRTAVALMDRRLWSFLRIR
jgi:hypothetical protein